MCLMGVPMFQLKQDNFYSHVENHVLTIFCFCYNLYFTIWHKLEILTDIETKNQNPVLKSKHLIPDADAL